MTQFHEGQEVEVWKEVRARGTDLHQNFVRRWCKAKIICQIDPCEVQFSDGARAVFDDAHIRPIEKPLKVGFDKVGSMVIE